MVYDPFPACLACLESKSNWESVCPFPSFFACVGSSYWKNNNNNAKLLRLCCILDIVYRIHDVCIISCFSCVHLFATLWTVACQDPLFMDSSRE